MAPRLVAAPGALSAPNHAGPYLTDNATLYVGRIMSVQIKTIGKHTLIYALGIMIGKAASFIMLPIYTRYLTPSAYGTLELLEMTTDVIGMIAGAGIASAVFKFYADYDTPEERGRVISTASWAVLSLSLGTAALGFALAPQVTRLVFRTPTPPAYFRLFFVIYFVQSAAIIPLLYLRALNKSVLFVSLNVGQLVLTLSLNILFVVALRLGVRGVLYSSLIAGTASALVVGTYVFRRTGTHFSTPLIRRLIRFSLPLVLWSLGSFVLTFSDRYFLNYYHGTAVVGLYSLAYQFGFVLAAFASRPFSSVWDPQRFEVAKQPDAGEVFRRVFFYMSLVVLFGAFAITVLVRDVIAVMAAPAFRSAYRVVPILLLTMVLQSWTSYCNIGIYLKHRTRLAAGAAIIGVVAALGLNLLLIPPFGAFGAAWATVGAFVVRFAVVYVASQRLYHVDYGWGRVLRLCLILAAAYVVHEFVVPDHVLASVSFNLALLAAVSAVVYAGVLDAAERAFILRSARRPLALLQSRS